MGKSHTALLALAVAALIGSAEADPINCPAYADKNIYYQGPDKQILYINHFATTPWVLKSDAVPYLNRLIGTIEAKGSHVVIMSPPVPPFAYLGKLDASTIKGTKFEAANNLSQESLEAAYLLTLKPFIQAGATIVDVQKGMLDYQRQHPQQQLFFKHDSHWHPNGAHAAAITTAEALKKSFPDILSQIPKKNLVVDDSKINQRISYQSWDGQIRAKCPEHVGLSEGMPDVALKEDNSEAVSSSLLDEEDNSVIIVGTSFTSPAKDANYGFEQYLSSALNTHVINESSEGGGPLGSMLHYYSTRGEDITDPKILIWEIPISQIGYSSVYPLDPVTFRQVLPFIESSVKKVAEFPINQLSKNNVIDTSGSKLAGGKYFMNIEFDKIQIPIPKLKAKLTYANGQSEDVELYINKGTRFPGYVIELPDNNSALTAVSFNLDQDASTTDRAHIDIYQENRK